MGTDRGELAGDSIWTHMARADLKIAAATLVHLSMKTPPVLDAAQWEHLSRLGGSLLPPSLQSSQSAHCRQHAICIAIQALRPDIA